MSPRRAAIALLAILAIVLAVSVGGMSVYGERPGEPMPAGGGTPSGREAP
jgi:hypothetical protein